MRSFNCQTNPARIAFGPGSLSRVAEEMTGQGGRRALSCRHRSRRADARPAVRSSAALSAGVFAEAAMHTPVEVTERALAAYAGTGRTARGARRRLDHRPRQGDRARRRRPDHRIPTTYAGSEMTPIHGNTEGGLKRTARTPRPAALGGLRPRPDDDPAARHGVISGMNAIAHAAEGLYAQDGNPVMSLMAEEGIRALAQAHAAVWPSPTTRRPARSASTAPGFAAPCSAMSAWRCTTSSATPSAAASTCPMRRRTPSSCPMRWPTTPGGARGDGADRRGDRRLRRARRAAPDGGRSSGRPTALRDLGLKEADLDRACEIALANPYWNPRPIEAAPLRDLLQRAWEGAGRAPTWTICPAA